MKPFLGIDQTENRKNEAINGNEFLIATPSPAMRQALEASSKKADDTVASSKLPLPIRILQTICYVMGAALILGILKALTGSDSVSLSQAYQNAPVLFYLAGGCVVLWLVLQFWSKKKSKSVLESDERQHLLSNLDSVCDSIFTELGVPNNAQEVDILSFRYKLKNDTVKPVAKGMETTPYCNLCFKAYADSENLYLANLDGKYAFALSELQTIRTVKRSIAMQSWNKDQSINEGRYKSYKLTVNDYGNIFCKSYHILQLRHGDQLWDIYFPSYELPIFQSLTGLSAE